MQRKSHPELKEGEVFLTNADMKHFAEIGWKSKRRGQIAYDHLGYQVKAAGFFPVFAQELEMTAGGIKITD